MINKNLDIYNLEHVVREFSGQYLQAGEKKVFGKFLRKGFKILDLGCGTGRTTSFLKEYDDSIIGADYSLMMIRKAKEKYPDINFIVADARNLPFQDEQFDAVIFAFNGLDYIYPKNERIVAIKEIRRVLKKEGLFIFTSHNSLRLPVGRKRLRDWLQNIFSFRWVYRYDNQEFGKLLTYFGSSFSQKRELKRFGFKNIFSTGNKFQNGIWMNLLEAYIYYVAQKI